MNTLRRTGLRALGTAALLATIGLAQAQTAPWPSKPVRIILPFTAGGTGAGVLRSMGPELSARLGQPIIMENMVGGTGMVGQDYTMRQPADGYTFVVLSISGVLAYHQLGKVVNFARDLTPVAQIYTQYGMLVSNPNLPEMANIYNLRQLIAYAKANPGKINFGSQGTGSIGHLVMEKIKTLAGISLVHVPYRGAAPGYNDLMAGHIQMMSTSLGALPYVKSGKMRAISIGSPTRLPAVPEVSTFIEEGLSGYVAGSWLGLAAPPNLPKPILDRMSAEIKGALSKPEVLEKLRTLGTDPEYLAPAEFAVRVQADYEQWGKIMRDNNIKPD